MWKKLKHYLISIAAALGVGGLSALLTGGGTDVFDDLVKPALTPPAIVFPIVWTILFTIMGISAAMVWEKGRGSGIDPAPALRVYALQLAVNFVWSLIFFNARAYLAAFVWLLLLWVLIAVMISRFAKISPVAARLQIPYLLWVSFAGYLNLMIYILNR